MSKKFVVYLFARFVFPCLLAHIIGRYQLKSQVGLFLVSRQCYYYVLLVFALRRPVLILLFWFSRPLRCLLFICFHYASDDFPMIYAIYIAIRFGGCFYNVGDFPAPFFLINTNTFPTLLRVYSELLFYLMFLFLAECRIFARIQFLYRQRRVYCHQVY